MSNFLDDIQQANDIKKLNPEDYAALAEEIRTFIINSVSVTGGHLASNLGVVELTMALHLCLDLPTDKLIWDVGHQAYTHKILTGRKGDFGGLRTFGGLSGFPKQKESDCDAFDTGHSSTSISAALGYAKARDLTGDDYKVVAVIGDGSMTGGMAYEALNNAARLDSNLIIVLNDNKMSISENVGGLSKHLNDLRMRQSYTNFKDDLETALKRIPHIGDSVAKSVKKSKDSIKQLLMNGGYFETLGLDYLGPIDGHDMDQLIRGINVAKRSKRPIVLHVLTQKGRGYAPAEHHPSDFHGVGKFDVPTGDIPSSGGQSYTDIFAMSLNRLAKNDDRIVAVTAAMPDGTGLTKFAKKYPKRFFDVGIAEEHAVTFAAGMAAGGMKPYVAVYSSFLQRGFDQIIHDVCIQKLPVTFCIDRAGLVGADGETHQGILDLSYLNVIPNMTICAPKNKYEFYDMLKFTQKFDGPIAVRYPRGQAYDGMKEYRPSIVLGKSEMIAQGRDIAILAVGSMVRTAMEVRELLAEEGFDITVVNARFIKPMDKTLLLKLKDTHKMIVTMEENMLNGGYGQSVSAWYAGQSADVPKILNIGIDDMYVEHGSVDMLKQMLEIDALSSAKKIKSMFLDEYK